MECTVGVAYNVSRLGQAAVFIEMLQKTAIIKLTIIFQDTEMPPFCLAAVIGCALLDIKCPQLNVNAFQILPERFSLMSKGEYHLHCFQFAKCMFS